MDVRNIVALEYSNSANSPFSAVNPFSGNALEGEFSPAGAEQIEKAMVAASEAFSIYKYISKDERAAFLRMIGDEIIALGDALLQRASEESGLPLGRLQGERGRTVAQLNMFADQVAEGSWVEAILDSALPEREPAPRPDLRRMLVPLGPVVVFGSSNFPLAFSVAGGDTASALAAGCPVVFKAHPAHPGTSALVASAIVKAAKDTGMPAGIFSLLYDDGHDVGSSLVRHPATRAVAFTGSFKGGMALNKIASERATPIPVFAEMSSINPVLLLPQAIEERAEQIAQEYATSITLGAGQFCTNPGLLIALDTPGLSRFKVALMTFIENTASATMLTPEICKSYNSISEKMLSQDGIEVLARSAKLNKEGSNQALAIVTTITAKDFLKNAELREEVFGPWSLLVVAKDVSELEEVIKNVGGQLTVSIMTGARTSVEFIPLLKKITEIAGRVLMNGVPTGVEVCHSMQHGGLFPSTTDSRFSSVGATAVRRFVRPVCWQSWQQDLLPDELKDGNPLNIWRLKDTRWTKD